MGGSVMQVSSKGSRSRPAAASHSTRPTMLQLLCLLAGLAATVTGACEAPFKVVGEGCYYFSNDDGINNVTWAEAHQYCLSMGSEVDLAVLDYLCHDVRDVGNYLLVQGTFLGFKDTWIGATGGDDTWFWVDGRPFDTASPYWNLGDPSESSGCVVQGFVSDDINPLRVSIGDYPCSHKAPFICQDFSAVMQQ